MALAAPAVPAAPLPVVALVADVSPTFGGSARHPVPATVRFGFSVNRESESVVSRVELFLPQYIRVTGRGLPRCRPGQAVRRCPSGSLVGRGTATLLVAPTGRQRRLRVRFFAGRGRTVTVVFGSGRDRVAVRGHLTAGGAPYGTLLRFAVPGTARVDSRGRSLDLVGFAGRLGSATSTYAGLTGCPPGGEHVFGLRLTFAPNPDPPPLATSPLVQDAAECG